MNALVILVPLLLAQPHGQPGKKVANDGIVWALSWEEALKEAKARNVPIHFAFHSDSGDTSARMADSVYQDEKMVRLSRNFVNVVALKDTGHGTHEVLVGKEKKTFCKLYWRIPCEVHTAIAKETERKFFTGKYELPVTIFCGPNGEEITAPARSKNAHTEKLLQMMEEALRGISGDKISYEVWAKNKKLIADGDAFLEKGDYRKAVDNYTKVAKLKQEGLKALGEEALKKAEEKGAALLEEAKSKIEADKEEAKKLLKKIAEGFKPLECAKAAAELLKTLP